MAGGEITPRTIEITEREARAIELRKIGHTYSVIGRTLGITTEGARKACERALRKTVAVGVDDYRKLMNDRFESAVASLWSLAFDGNDKDARRDLIAIFTQIRQMNGLDVKVLPNMTGDAVTTFQNVIMLGATRDPAIDAKLNAGIDAIDVDPYEEEEDDD